MYWVDCDENSDVGATTCKYLKTVNMKFKAAKHNFNFKEPM